MAVLAEAIAAGVTPGDIAELRRQVQPSGAALTTEGVANAAKALSYIRSASLPVADGLPVLAEAARRGYRSDELVDVGRLIKRREADYRSGRASLRALRDAIARGERPEQPSSAVAHTSCRTPRRYAGGAGRAPTARGTSTTGRAAGATAAARAARRTRAARLDTVALRPPRLPVMSEA